MKTRVFLVEISYEFIISLLLLRSGKGNRNDDVMNEIKTNKTVTRMIKN